MKYTYRPKLVDFSTVRGHYWTTPKYRIRYRPVHDPERALNLSFTRRS